MNARLPSHGGQLGAIARRFGIDASGLLDFSASINPDGPPTTVVHALEAALKDAATLTQYPDLEEIRLKAALAHYTGTAAEIIFVANGFAPLLDAVLRTLQLRECLLPVPCFSEYRRTLEQHRVQVSPLGLEPQRDFRYDVETLLNGSHDAILLANPQNPSGVLCERAQLFSLVERAAARGVYVLLDEAFIDYQRDASLLSVVHRFENLVVFRSVTKCFGVPGLRVAYAAAAAPMRQRFEANLAPWSISTLASLGIIAAVEDLGFAAQIASSNRTRRDQLNSELKACDLAVYPAAANFLLLRLPPERNAEQFWQRMITDHRIVMRSCESFEGMPPGHLRVAVRDAEDNRLLGRALAALLETASW